MSSLERPPTCIKVKYSVHATCTYANVSAACPVVSSACNSPAVGNRAHRCGRNSVSSRAAARPRTPARNPLDTRIPVRSIVPPTRWSAGRSGPGFPDTTPAPPRERGRHPSRGAQCPTRSRQALGYRPRGGAPAARRATSLPGSTGRGTSVTAGSLTWPHPPQRRDTSGYSVTFGGGGTSTSTTWRRTRPVSAASCNDCSHRAHRSGATSKVSSESSIRRRRRRRRRTRLSARLATRLAPRRAFPRGLLIPRRIRRRGTRRSR
jgi:hypothetical protein